MWLACARWRYLYIKHYMPYVPRGQRLRYLWRMVATKAWQKHYDEGKTDAITSRFFKPKPSVEELYDTAKDPDNSVNLSGNPEYREVMERMRPVLRSWQLKIHDSGLLPETERIRRAQEHGMTIYDMVRNENLYDLRAYLDAADIALAGDSNNQKTLLNMLENDDLAIRYWGTIGLFILGNPPRPPVAEAFRSTLKDDSDEIRAMAAWALIRSGDKVPGRKCLLSLLKNNSYATLAVLNIIDWMDDDMSVYLPAIKSVQKGNYEKRMRDYLVKKYG